MTARELLFEAMRANQHQSLTSEEYATFSRLPVETVEPILEDFPWSVVGRAMPPHSRYWMVGRIEVPPTRKSDDREVTEWNALYAMGRLTTR